MNKNKEFEKMSNEELCAIAMRLKIQLVEARFKMSSGEIEKISVIKQIRRMIAKIFTELTNRGFKVSIGAHGITMYDIKNGNKPMSLDQEKLNKLMEDQDKDTKKKPAKEEKAEKPAAKEVAKEVKKPATKEVAKEVKKGDKE